MAEVQVGILGLGRVGASVGLALKNHTAQGGKHKFIITGYDTVAEKGRIAKEIGAIDHFKNRIGEAARDKAIVIMAMPYGEVDSSYSVIGKELSRGTVVLDFSALKVSTMQSAAKHMPENTHLVCIAPIFNPKYLFDSVDETVRASADLFEDGMMMLMPSVKCAEAAITLANDVSGILGALPQYFDAAEHDVLISATEALPAVLGVAYFINLQQSDSWDDTRRLTNPSFGIITHDLFDKHPDDLTKVWLDNADQIVRHINAYIKTLTALRDILQDKDRRALSALLEEKAKAYETWINNRHHNTWHKDKLAVKTATFGDTIGGTLFGGFFRKRDDDED